MQNTLNMWPTLTSSKKRGVHFVYLRVHVMGVCDTNSFIAFNTMYHLLGVAQMHGFVNKASVVKASVVAAHYSNLLMDRTNADVY